MSNTLNNNIDFKLKPLSKDAIPAALEKATRYRLLNEPGEAESVCLDVLSAEPDNQNALVTLLLALTDRFAKGYGIGDRRAEQILPRLRNEYDRAYYAGIVEERRAKARLHQGTPGASFTAFEELRDAMSHYEKAEALRSPGNDDVLLRWNACVRLIKNNRLEARSEEALEPYLE